MKSSLIKLIFAAIVAVVLIYLIRTQATWNFGILGFVFLAALIAIPLMYRIVLEKRLKDNNTFKAEGFDYALISACIILGLGFLSVYTLNNYFYADKSIYTNVDHHAIRLDGIKLSSPNGFELAGNSRNAFFDSEEMNGRATVMGVNDSAVAVRLTGFTRAIYFNEVNSKGRCYKRTLAINDALLHFKDGEQLQLRLDNDSVYMFSAKVIEKDSVKYEITTPNGEKIISDEHRFLLQGLPLSRLVTHPQIPSEIFSGIHIIRPDVYPLVKMDERISKYKDVGYAVEIQGTTAKTVEDSANYVVALRVGNGTWQSVKPMTDVTIQIPMNKFFMIGYDNVATRPAFFSHTGNGLSLLFQLPMYHYLQQDENKGFNSTYVTTSLSSYDGDLATIPENILLYDVFAHHDNINQMTPAVVSFVSGPTTQELQFKYTFQKGEQNTARAGDFFKNARAIGTDHVEWIVAAENFKQTSPYQPKYITLIILLFSLALACMILFGATKMGNQNDAALNTFTVVEFAAYVVTLYLMTIRWFLLWRTSVFPPVEQINAFEFNGLFRNTDNGMVLTIAIIAFVLIVLVAKLLIRLESKKYWRKSLKKRLVPKFHIKKKFLIATWLLVLAVALVACIGFRHSGKASVIIFIPVFLYLVNSVIINKLFAGHYQKSDQAYDSIDIHDKSAKLIFWSVINILVFTWALLFIDSGFGIIFFTFSIFWTLWILHEHVSHYLSSYSYNVKRNLVVLLLFVMMLTTIYFYKEIIGFVYRGGEVFGLNNILGNIIVALLFAVIGVIVAVCVFYTLSWRNKTTVIGWAVGLALVFSGTTFGFRYYVSNHAQHTAQRISVQFARPSEAMSQIEDDGTEYRYLQAALNHMIIGEYSRRGNDISLIGEHGHGYFKMQPHSKVGALWNAQLTDISLVRFVVAEHSQWLPLLIVGFFLLMLLCAAMQPLYHRWARWLLLLIPLLLMVQSLLIWMATTQRFIFLGQDFPMISVNSRLTVIYYFSLIVIWVLVAVYEKVNFFELYDYDYNQDSGDETNNNKWRFDYARRDTVKILIIMGACMLCGVMAKQGVNQPSFELTKLMERFEKQIEDPVNELFAEYQKEHPIVKYVHGKPVGMKRDFSKEMQAFNNEMKIDSVVFGKFPFGRKLWKDFIKNGSKENNSRQVLHLHLKHKKLALKTINYFYNQSLPVMVDKQWRGNIVAMDSVEGGVRTSVTNGSLVAYRLPGEWMADGNERTIVSSIGSRVVGPDLDFTMRHGIYSAVLVNDRIHVDNESEQLRQVTAQKRYLARNAKVNGQRRFFYPMKESFYWIKDFAEEVSMQKSKTDEKDRNNDFHSDVEVTISPSLTQSIYRILSRAGTRECAVMIADGDGEVLTMVDYDQRYHLDPNDNRKINRLMDSLYMYGAMGSETARRAFANANLIALKYGPGSSQKPLVWTAVASRLDYDWQNLRIEAYEGRIPLVSGHFVITNFNETSFLAKHPLKPLKSDENGGSVLTVRDYMMHSSNVYNAVMAYIGSFLDSDLSNGNMAISDHHDDGSTLFSYFDVPMTDNLFVSRFPVMSMAGRRQFSFNRKPIPANQPSSILELSMKDMFFRNDSVDELRNDLYSNVATGLLDAGFKKGDRRNYAYVERSHFESRQGSTEKCDKNFLEFAIRSTAIGASKVWYVTPWKMAESFGRIASLNRNLHLSVLKRDHELSYVQFANLSQGYLKARPIMLQGMGDVISTSGGTAWRTGKKLDMSDYQLNGYYLYAKTGTIGDKSSEDNHRLGIIISNRDLTNTPLSRLSDVRYIVIYFTFNESRWDTYAAVILELMNSIEFRQYMNNH